MSDLIEHTVSSTDALIRGRRGTVAECACGWRSEWWVRDGSAEADAHAHMLAYDAKYRARHVARVSEHSAAERERGCTCERFEDSYGYVVDLECPRHRPRESVARPVQEAHQHECSCHINPPCGACEGCRHADHPECPNDCQTCEEHDDE